MTEQFLCGADVPVSIHIVIMYTGWGGKVLCWGLFGKLLKSHLILNSFLLLLPVNVSSDEKFNLLVPIIK